MGFGQAIASAFKNSRNMTGRATRSEFWFFYLFCWLLFIPVVIAAVFASTAITDASPIHYSPLAGKVFLAMIVIYLAIMFFPFLSLSIRRLHDADMSAWMLLIHLVPTIGSFAMLVIYAQPGTRGPNICGEDPSATRHALQRCFSQLLTVSPANARPSMPQPASNPSIPQSV